MAKINFPDPQDTNPWYNPANGITYVHANDTWSAVTVNNTNFDDTYVNVDGDQMTGDLTVPSLNGGPLAGFRNLIINGDFRIWQRGTIVDVTGTPQYHADRWYTGEPAGEMSKKTKYGGVPVLESTESRYIQQAIELPLDESGDATAGPFLINTTWTLSYYSTVAPAGGVSTNIQFRNNITGEDEINVSSSVPALTPTGKTLGSGNELVQYSTTFTVTSAPNADNRCLVVHCTGDTTGAFTGQDIAYAQLEEGPVATPFEHRPIGTELALCQRYYERRATEVDNERLSTTGLQIGFNDAQVSFQHLVPKRIAPITVSIGHIENTSFYNGDSNVGVQSYGLDNTSKYITNLSFRFSAPNSGSVGGAIHLTRSGGATPAPYVEFDAEL